MARYVRSRYRIGRTHMRLNMCVFLGFSLGVLFTLILTTQWNRSLDVKLSIQEYALHGDQHGAGLDGQPRTPVEGRVRINSLSKDSGRPYHDHDSVGPAVDDTPPKECVKKIHIFGQMQILNIIPEVEHIRNVLFHGDKTRNYLSHMDCKSKGYQCNLELTLSNKLEDFPGKDAIVFNMVAREWVRTNFLKRLGRTTPAANQTWLFYSTESPHRLVRWAMNFDIELLKYHVLMTYHSDSEIHIPFGLYTPFRNGQVRPGPDDDFYNRTGLVAWAGTNCYEVFWPRIPFVKALNKLLPRMDTYGTCGNKTCLPRRSFKCNQVFRTYKFFLALPNTECHQYITEKFWTVALNSGIIPIVYGAKKADYEKVAPPKSFIHAADFESMQDLANYLLKVDGDDALFRSYFEWRKHGAVSLVFPPPLHKICEVLPYIRERDPGEARLIGNSTWYNECRERPYSNTLNLNYNQLKLESWSMWDKDP